MKNLPCSLSVLLAAMLFPGQFVMSQPRPQDLRGPGQPGGGPGQRDFDREHHSSGRYVKPHVNKYQFAGRKHVEKLADDLYNQANNICWDLHNNYNKRHPDFNSIYRDMYNVKEDAKRISQLVQNRISRRPGSDDQIERELTSMHRRFQAFQADLRDWKPVQRRSSSNLSLAESIAECEDTLHHLMDDYGVRYDAPRNYGDKPGSQRDGGFDHKPQPPRGGDFDRR